MTHLKRGTLWIEEQGPIRWRKKARRVWRNTGYERFRFQRKAATENDYIFKTVINENKCNICICFWSQLSLPPESIQKKLFRGTFIIPAVMDKSKIRLRKDGQSPSDII